MKTVTELATNSRFVPFWRAEEGDTTFLMDNNLQTAVEKVKKCRASKVYICESIAYRLIRYHGLTRPETLIACENPKLEFIKALRLSGIEKEKASEGMDIVPVSNEEHHVIIGEGCSIRNTLIGKNVTIHPNTTIGAFALAVERDHDADGMLVTFPHIGRVIIEDDVTIGSQVNISRGELEDTIIGENTVIDAHVHVAHNCKIGKRNQITAGSIFGGSITTGDDCWFGLGCTILDHVKIGNNVLVGAGATVIHDVPDKDIVAGTPAKSIKEKSSLSERKRYHYVGY